jgi:hypothetical protein
MIEMAAIVPSRGRPANVKRLCEAFKDTNALVDLYIGVDDDDNELYGYEHLAEEYGFKLIVGKRERFGPTLNRIAMDIANDYRFLYWCGDDHVPRTWEWDRVYRTNLKEMQVGVVYGDDLFQGEAIATQLALTSNIVSTLGYAIPQGFTHLFIDNYFMELTRAIDKLRYVPDVVVEHMHYGAWGKAQEDQTYREANSSENWTNDRIRFERYVAEELPEDAEKLRRLCESL